MAGSTRASLDRQGSCEYVYAIVEGLPRQWQPPSGIGASPVVARPVRDLALITSAVDATPRRTSRTVALHDGVVSSTLEAEAVLPLEFGTITSAPHFDRWLTAHLGFVRTHLARLRRHVEMPIRLVSLAATPGAGSLLRTTAGSLIEHAGLAEWRYHDEGSAGLSSSLAFLVPRDAVGDLLARIAPVAARTHGVAVVPTGPCAPLSFSPRLRTALASEDGRLARAG